MKVNAFGEKIALLRKKQGLSQFQLGKLTGVTDKAVSKWENGESYPRVEHCIKIAEILEVSLDELIRLQYQEKAAGIADKQEDIITHSE